jgi:hypothetical protein
MIRAMLSLAEGMKGAALRPLERAHSAKHHPFQPDAAKPREITLRYQSKRACALMQRRRPARIHPLGHGCF